MKHLGIDVHLKSTEICELSEAGALLRRERIATTEPAIRRFFGRLDRRRIVMECSGHTPWLYRLLRELGHEVVVVDPRQIALINRSTLKSDRIDAEILARLSRFDGELLCPVYQRSIEAQELRTRLKVRQTLVRTRAQLIHTVRGSVRAHGYRLSSCATAGFVSVWGQATIDEDLRAALDPLVETIAELTQRIETLEKALKKEARDDELMMRLQEVPGVGPLVALAYVAWMDRAERFAKSEDVGASLGLRPRVKSSGETTRRGRITCEGDVDVRTLLVQAAHASFLAKQDSALKQWGRRLESRVGKSKAVVAMARKLAVILHRMWVTGESYHPFPQQA